MKIFVTGGTGFVGTRLLPFLVEQGHAVQLLVRAQEKDRPIPRGVEVVVGDPLRPGAWWDGVGECHAAVNLAGSPVFSRWDPQVKAMLRESRLATTRNLVHAIPKGRPFTLVSASGIGIFGDAGEEILDESASFGDDFLATVAREWEEEALRGEKRGARVCLARFGIVFGPGGGALEELVRNTGRYLGGRLGSGRQWMPWVHREDVVRAVLFLLDREGQRGPFNFTSPNPVRQVVVARTLARLMGRPALAVVPPLVLRLVIGECAKVVLFSQRAVPRKLQQAGFQFLFPDLEPALREILPGYGVQPRGT